MSNLINIGLVTSHKEGRFVRYFIEGDVNDIIYCLSLTILQSGANYRIDWPNSF